MPTKKILIADDETDLVKVLVTRFTSLGYEVVSAVNGEETVAKIKQEKPDLLILDVLMPKQSGLQVMQWLRDHESARRLPVLVISGKENMRDLFTDLPIQEFISKPLDMKTFISKVEKLVGKSGKGDAAAAKKLLLLGVKEALVSKVRDLLTAFGWEVSIALDENDAFKMAGELCPDAILCEYANPEWEGYLLDTSAFTKRLGQDQLLSRIPLYVYCSSGAFLEALKLYSTDRLIKYSETSDLLASLTQKFGRKAP